jgi:hypothetical protein
MTRLQRRVAHAGFDSLAFVGGAVTTYLLADQVWVALMLAFIGGARLNDVLVAATDEQVRALEEQVRLLKGGRP